MNVAYGLFALLLVLHLGSVRADGVRQLACTGEVKDKCCGADFRRNLCTCRNCDGPWFRASERGAATRSFSNRSGDLCLCIETADEGAGGKQEEETKTPEIIPVEGPKDTQDGTPSKRGDGDGDSEPKKGQVSGDRATITCPGAVDTTCSAFASLQILVTGGSCKGTATADCKSVSRSQNAFKETFDEWWSDEGVCDSGKAEAAASAVAKAIAKVWANAAVKVTCEGMGFACGWSISDGQAWSVAFAEAIAQAAAETNAGTEADAFCFADVRSLAGVIAEAAATSQADACTTGGTVEDFESSYAASIQTGIASAFAKATAEACNADGELAASSSCSGVGESEAKGETFAHGDACAGLAQIETCAGPGVADCCSPRFRRRLCNCSRDGCRHGPWVRKSDFDARSNALRSFEDRRGNVCFCAGDL